MGIFQVVATGVLCAVLAIIIKKQSPEIALIITIASSVLIFLMILPMLTQAVGVLTNVGNMLDGGFEYVSLALRVIGVAYMAELGSSVCTDAGESAIATKIDLGGRVIIMVMAMPVVIDIVTTVLGLLP
ncbi:MAG: stage III sporulation AC/AD family protein [Defluviitaleaceae bacterium]|nr:stage III sporulation AC/AD family protein [Defluviitaleaceae bacterium]